MQVDRVLPSFTEFFVFYLPTLWAGNVDRVCLFFFVCSSRAVADEIVARKFIVTLKRNVCNTQRVRDAITWPSLTNNFQRKWRGPAPHRSTITKVVKRNPPNVVSIIKSVWKSSTVPGGGGGGGGGRKKLRTENPKKRKVIFKKSTGFFMVAFVISSIIEEIILYKATWFRADNDQTEFWNMFHCFRFSTNLVMILHLNWIDWQRVSVVKSNRSFFANFIEFYNIK